MSTLITRAAERLRADLASAVGALGAGLISFVQTAVGSVAVTLQSWLRWQTVDMFEFMTAAQIADVLAGTLTIDVTAACQAALNTGRRVKARKGKYLLSDELVPVAVLFGVQKIEGDGIDATQFVQSVAGKNGFTVAVKVDISHLSITCSAVSTAIGLQIGNANPTYTTDVKVTSFLTNIKVLAAARNTHLQRVTALNALLDNCEIEGAVDVYLTEVYFGGANNAAHTGCNLAISGAASGVYINGAQLVVGDFNFKTRFLQPANVADIPSQIFVTALISDSAVGNGIYHEQGNAIIYTGGWSSNKGTGKNCYVGPQVTDVQFNGFKTFNCVGHGLEVQGIRTSINGGSFQDASFGADNTFSNIHVTGASATGTVINGVRCYSDAGLSRYGVRVTGGANNTTVLGGDLRGNVTAAYLDDSGATGNIVRGVGGIDAEGAWVPADASGAGLALTVAGARASRVGNTVNWSMNIVYPATASGADAQISGLPHASAFVVGGACYTNTTTVPWYEITGASIKFVQNTLAAYATNAQLSGKFVKASGSFSV